MEYHIPVEFTQERPAIAFTHVNSCDVRKADHPLASKLPQPSSRPAVVGDPDECIDLARSPGSPSCIEDYLYSDRPLLGLHVVSLQDATLVTLHWLHIACDAMGMKALVGGWVLSMQGKEIPEQQGFDYDPMADLGKNPTEPHVLKDKCMSASSLLMYGLRNGYSLTAGKKECRIVCIPGYFLDGLKAAALKDLKASGVESPFLTDNDVLTAWWTRMALGHLPAESDRPVTVQIAMSLRKALQNDLLSPHKPYVSNCFGFTNILLPASEFRKDPLSGIASQIRGAINKQSTREQVESYQAMVRASMAPLPVFMGTGATHQISYSNWTKADLFAADFSAAAVRPRKEPLYASYIAHCQVPFQFPEGFIVIGKDSKANTWLCGYRVAGLWDKIEEELASLA